MAEAVPMAEKEDRLKWEGSAFSLVYASLGQLKSLKVPALRKPAWTAR